MDHLTKEFKLPRQKEMFKAVDDVSFSIKKGTTLAIVGESGSGKSTVANMVLKLLEPTVGTSPTTAKTSPDSREGVA